MTIRLYNGDCLDVLDTLPSVDCLFADPPDNIGLGYKAYKDKLPNEEYVRQLGLWLYKFIRKAPIVWLSFNARWTCDMGKLACSLAADYPDLEIATCVQTFTFGQHCHSDLGNCHRPLWRFRRNAPLYPDQIRVPSWRQRNGDKRADPRGRVPGDVFDFPRVTGNSKQRRRWHPTQLHEGLVERCIRLSTPDNAPSTVIDPFGGTGTTARVCERLGRDCTLIEMDPTYCQHIARDHALCRLDDHYWRSQ